MAFNVPGLPLPLLFLLGAFQRGLEGANSAFGAATQQNQVVDAAAVKRNRLNQLIDRVNAVDPTIAGSAASRDLTRQLNALAATTAQANTSSAGATQASADRIAGEAAAQLARFQAADQAQRAEVINRILQDPAFSVPEQGVNPTLQALMGLLTGAVGGGGQVLNAALANPEAFRGVVPEGADLRSIPIPQVQAQVPQSQPVTPQVTAGLQATPAGGSFGSSFLNAVFGLNPSGTPNRNFQVLDR